MTLLSLPDEAIFNRSNGIATPKQVMAFWKQTSPEDQEKLIIRAVEYWKKQGFPFIEKDRQQLAAAVQKLVSYDVSRILCDGDQLGQVNIGVEVCNSYHPKMFKVRCNGQKFSVFEAFHDEKRMRRAMRKSFQIGGVIDGAMVRSMVRTSGAQMPSNFNPAVAAWIYQTFCPRDGFILDPSSGWGGRALAAITSPHVHYTGIDPHEEANVGNRRMIEDIFDIRRDLTSTVKIIDGCAEDVIPTLPKDHFHVIFTSPPYFNVEQYDDDPNQSYKKHGSDGYKGWVEGFLRPVLWACSQALHPEGVCIFNVSEQIRKKHNFAEDTRRIGSEYMDHIHTYQQRLVLRTQLREKAGSTYRFEPFFLFKKKGQPTPTFPTKPLREDEVDDMRLF